MTRPKASRPDRRQVLASALALPLLRIPFRAPRREPLSILILGGTGFLGPAVVDVAKARGHKLTLFNRGKTRPHLFPDLEKLHGDRDPKKGEGLKALEGRSFDAVVDTSGYYPRMVTASAELLAPRIGQYVYISSISAYKETARVGQTEDAPVATIPDPTVETMGKEYENYGALKALCEEAAEKACPKKTTNIRPGYIVGPGDGSDRYTHWPVRGASGGEFIVPGDGSDPVQIIDVRDLAAFMVTAIETKAFGVFNACGPKDRLTMKELIASCTPAEGGGVAVWAPVAWLREQGRNIDADFPIFAPAQGDTAGFHQFSNAKACKAGLAFRPVAETARDTLAWWNSLPEERRAKPRAGIGREDEAKLLEAFAARKK